MEIFEPNVISFIMNYIFMHYPYRLYFDAVIQRLESVGAFMLKINALDVESFYTSVPIECHMGLELFIYARAGELTPRSFAPPAAGTWSLSWGSCLCTGSSWWQWASPLLSWRCWSQVWICPTVAEKAWSRWRAREKDRGWYGEI